MAKEKRSEAPAERREESIIDPRRVETAAPEAPVPEPAKPGHLRPVEDHAKAQGLPAWELAALRQATGWAPGKTVSVEQFGQALEQLRKRRLGCGRITKPGQPGRR